MAFFTYKVRDTAGRTLTGIIEAESEANVVEHLRGRDYFIVDIKEKKVNNFSINVPKKMSRGVKSKDLAVFCRQFATLMNAGVPILTCLQILQEQAENLKLQETLANVMGRLESGRSLADSVRAYPKIFPEIFVNMVETGEIGGVLDEVLERLAAHFEREHDIGEKVKSAMTYPVAILVIAVLAITFMLIYILPTFVGMLGQSGGTLPLPTRIVMGLSSLLQNFWWAMLILTAGLIYGLGKVRERPEGKEKIDEIILKLPVAGQLVQKMIISRFARTLGTMLKSGVPIIEALETVKKTVGNEVVARELDLAKENIIRGKGIAEPLKGSGVFPQMVTQMIAVGEETGALDTLLERVAFFYDREVDNIVNRLSTLIEPIMIVGLGAVLGFMIIAMMLPMFDVMSAAPN